MSNIIKYLEHPVNMYTGIPSITVPIFDIDFDGNKVPISLQYHSSGLRVNEVSNNIGLGWNLSYGGVVTRTIRDKDDLQQNTLHNITNCDTLPFYYEPFYNDNGTFLGTFCDNSPKGVYFQGFAYGSQDDLEFDLFTFSLPNGASAKFMQFMDGSYKTLPISNYKIKRVNNSNTGNFEYWQITDENGFIYYFGLDPYRNIKAQERTLITTTKTNPQETSIADNNTSWFIMRIVSPNGNSIEYNYDDTKYEYKSSIGQSVFFYNYSGFYTLTNSNYVRLIETYNRYYTSRIKLITFPEGKVEFEYGVERKDVLSVAPSNVALGEHPRMLQKLIVYNKKNDIVKNTEFTHKYFSPIGSQDGSNINTNSNYLDYRLKLDKVSFYDNIHSESLDYKFIYEEEINLPNRMSSKTDFWGYFNNKDANVNPFLPNLADYPIVYGASLDTYSTGTTPPGSGTNSLEGVLQLQGANKSADPFFTKANTLKEIVYPSGGSTQFFYENHIIKYFQNFHPANPVTEVKEVFTHNFEGDLSENEAFTFIPAQNLLSSNPTLQHASIHFEVIVGENEFINNVFAIRFFCVNTNTFFDVTSSGNVAGKANLIIGNSYKVSIIPWNNNSLNSFNASVKIIWSIPSNDAPGYSEYNKLIGGLRIKAIKHLSGTDKIENITEYNYLEDNNLNISSGEILEYPDICSITQNILGFGNVLGITVNSQSSSPFLTPSSTNVGYLRVTKIDKSFLNGDDQKTIYTFLPTLFDMTEYSSIQLLPVPYDFADWRRGLPQSELIMVKKGNIYVPLKEINYGYSFQGLNGEKFENINYKHQSNTGLTTSFRRYTLSTERFWKNLLEIRDYDNTSSIPSNTFTQTKYYYENPNYQSPTKTESWNSKGEKFTTDFKYPYNFSTIASNIELVNRNIIGSPIKQTQTVTKNNVIDILSTIETEYNLFHNNILPSSMKKSYGANNTETEIEIQNYDVKGKIEQFRSKNGLVNSYIYAYNNTYPVAKIIGSTYNNAISQSNINLTYLNSLTDENAIRIELNKLRNIPNAFVTTYTYKPLVGITSETDANGKTTYYEYDSFNRLKHIKDKDGNILKVYDYKYKATPNQ